MLGGLATGARLPVIGLTTNRSIAELAPCTRHDVKAAAALVGVDGLPQGAAQVLDRYIGPGYAQPSRAGMAAITLSARFEGLPLDPCHTEQSMAAAIDLSVRRFKPGRNVVSIHIGCTPAIFSYAADLTSGRQRAM